MKPADISARYCRQMSLETHGQTHFKDLAASVEKPPGCTVLSLFL
jgi:hypothetical protein